MILKVYLTIRGNLKVRKSQPGKDIKYDILMGHLPLRTYLTSLFKGGEYTQIHLERMDHRKFYVQGKLDLLNNVTDIAIYKNGQQIDRDTYQQIEMNLNDKPFDVNLGELFKDLEDNEWQDHGYCKCEVKILRRSNVN